MERNPRIYMAIATFHPIVGGAEKQAFAQCRMLRVKGYEASVVTLRHDRQWQPRETIDGVPVLRVAGALLARRDRLPRVLQRFLYMLALLSMGWTLWRQRKRYDIIHVHQFTLLVVPAALVCWLVHKPLIIVVHSAGLGKRAENTWSLIAGPLDAALPWLKVDALPKIGGDLANLQRLGTYGMRCIHALLLRIHAVPVVISSRMKGYLAHYNFSLPGTRLIPNGVDIEHFLPYPCNATLQEDRARTVVCVARLSYEKGIDVLLQAWHLVQQHLPGMRLLIVGSGPIEAQLRQMAAALAITNSVEFTGVRNDISALMHRGSIAVLPSRWEGMPVVALEAMACGLPCVATRVSGSEDIIQHGTNGLLADPEDYHSIAQALVTLLRDPPLVETYGRAARRTIEQGYSLEHVTSAYLTLYREVIQHRAIEDGGSDGTVHGMVEQKEIEPCAE